MKKNKKLVTWILAVLIIVLAVTVAFVVFRKKEKNRREAEIAARTAAVAEKIVGTWSYDIQGEYATGYYTFTDSGSLQMNYDILYMPEGQNINTDGMGSVNYSIENGDTLVLDEYIMGISRQESFPIRFEGEDIMYIQDTCYERVKE